MSPPTRAVGPSPRLGEGSNILPTHSGLSDEEAQDLQHQNRELKTNNHANTLLSAAELVQPIVERTSEHVLTVAELERQGYTAPDLRRALVLAVNEGIFASGDAARGATVRERWAKWKGVDEDNADVQRLDVQMLRAVLVECSKDVQTLRKELKQ